MDAELLKKTWAEFLQHGDRGPAYFYSHLHLAHPETRALFPIGMARQRDRLVTALGDVIANVDNLDAAVPILQRLGRDHARRYGVEPKHYPWVADALLASLEYHLGDSWTPEAAGTWRAAYQLVADVMTAATERPFDQEVPHGR